MGTMVRVRDVTKIISTQTLQRLGVAFALFFIPVYLFVELADEVRERDTLPFDETVLRAVNSVASPLLDAMAVAITQLGGVIGVLAITAGAVLILWGRGLHKKALLLLIGVGGGVILNVLLKAIFQRDRPQLWERIVTENSYSFPSGHAMASSALALSLIVLFWPTKWRWLVVIIASLYMIVIALTRLYLGVHYPTDILAGWMVSGAWVALVMSIVSYRRQLTSLLSRGRH